MMYVLLHTSSFPDLFKKAEYALMKVFAGTSLTVVPPMMCDFL